MKALLGCRICPFVRPPACLISERISIKFWYLGISCAVKLNLVRNRPIPTLREAEIRHNYLSK
jgi:hypothetical protein